MEIRTDSIIVNQMNNKESIVLDFFPDEDGLPDEAFIPLKHKVSYLVVRIKECVSIETLKNMLLNEFFLEPLLPAEIDIDPMLLISTEEYLYTIEDSVYDDELYALCVDKFRKYKEQLDTISDIMEIESITIKQYYCFEGGPVKEDIGMFLEDILETNIDITDGELLKDMLKDKLNENEIFNIIEQIEDDSISSFEASIETTITLSDGDVSTKYKFNKLA